ncbi:SIS domain-containing protein [Rhodococcus globerulus]|uniref:SIS domain-containing protein n=1 Tax=Rhodococcus globerulus TaxID=33008 RepID=A0ABU4C2Z2_RHOGO|nr:SIS domain-containing protein [Rhodococcus globerulus]MDV6270869.1 SIS domain-containing protein [Rhodococcus globerulus]
MAVSDHVLQLLTEATQISRPSERRVAQVVLANPDQVLGMSMAVLAAESGVSEPTVMRLCTGMGYTGFQAFKLALTRALAIGRPVTYSAIEHGDDSRALITKIFDHTLTALDRTRKSLNVDAVEGAVVVMSRASETVFVGLGASGILAQDAAQKAALLGMPCSAPMDTHQQFMAACMATDSTVFVAISHTGRTASVLTVARQAQSNGAAVVAIVGGSSPLAELADVAIVLDTPEDTDIHTPTISRLAGLVLIDVLVTSIALERGPEHLERLRQMKESLVEFRGR